MSGSSARRNWHIVAVSLFAAVAIPAHVGATLITVEPDDFPDGTQINTAVAGVTLSASGGTVGTAIFARTFGGPCCPYAVQASTGIRGFGHAGTNNIVWKASHPRDPSGFRADFDVSTDFVAIDVIQPSTSGVIATVTAFDIFGLELDSFVAIGTGMSSVAVASFSRIAPDIAYILISTNASDFSLDNLRFNAAVPEPSALPGLSVLLLGFVRLAARLRRRGSASS